MPTNIIKNLPKTSLFSSFALGFLVICLVVYILHVARAIMVPFVIALFVWYLINAIARLLSKQTLTPFRIPRFFCFLFGILCLLGITSMVVGLVSQNIAQLMQQAPVYQQKLEQVLPRFVQILHLDHEPTVRELIGYIDIESVLGVIASTSTGIAGKTLVIIFYVGFLLYEQRFFDRKIRTMFKEKQTETHVRQILSQIDIKIQRYIGVKSMMSATDSFLTYVILSVAGVAFAEFWGLMAFFLHFIPYAGSLVAISVPALIALIQFPDLTHTLFVVASLCISHAFIGHILDPYMMGSNLNLSPIFIISSLAMWGMIWGVPGMFLAIPILAIVAITLSQFETTRPIAVLLSKTGHIVESATTTPKKAKKQA